MLPTAVATRSTAARSARTLEPPARDTARQGAAEVIRPAAPAANEVGTIDESLLVALWPRVVPLFSPAQGRLVAFGYSAVTLAGLAVVSLTAWHLMGLV